MIVLGVSGANEREHDPACCLMKNGELVAMVEEERFVREKHAPGVPPHNSIRYCLDFFGISLDQIDFVALGWDYSSSPNLQALSETFFPQSLFPHNKTVRFRFYNHHLAHAASSFFFSGFDESLIMVMDGQGENDSSSIGFGFTRNGKKHINFIKKYPINLSLGYMYDKVGEFVGLGHWSAGKLMGLAPYGVEDINIPIMLKKDGDYDIAFKTKYTKDTNNLDDEDQMTGIWTELLESICPNIIIDSASPSIEAKNLALSTQAALEKVSELFMKQLIRFYPDTNKLCVSGGVGLNCANNTNLKEKFHLSEVFVQPAANDAGIVLGAAALCSQENGFSVEKLKNAYYGPKYTDMEIVAALKKSGLQYSRPKNLLETISKALVEQKVVGWFQGRMEFGPRALGNRSILASPEDPEMLGRLNLIKGREPWRPLAPIVLEEDSEKYFGISDSPYMLFFAKVDSAYTESLVAVNHVDGTTRPQTVDNQNVKLRKLLLEYKKVSGSSVLINTSFNIAGEPMVCTPKDAIKSFLNSDIDALVMGEYIVEK